MSFHKDKGTIHEGKNMNSNLYAYNYTILKYMRQKLIEIKKEILNYGWGFHKIQSDS